MWQKITSLPLDKNTPTVMGKAKILFKTMQTHRKHSHTCGKNFICGAQYILKKCKFIV
jgi:hypothetical protein